jgi:hypothetical protein
VKKRGASVHIFERTVEMDITPDYEQFYQDMAESKTIAQNPPLVTHTPISDVVAEAEATHNEAPAKKPDSAVPTEREPDLIEKCQKTHAAKGVTESSSTQTKRKSSTEISKCPVCNNDLNATLCIGDDMVRCCECGMSIHACAKGRIALPESETKDCLACGAHAPPPADVEKGVCPKCHKSLNGHVHTFHDDGGSLVCGYCLTNFHFCPSGDVHVGSPGPRKCLKCHPEQKTPEGVEPEETKKQTVIPAPAAKEKAYMLCPSCKHPAGDVDGWQRDGGSTKCPSCGQIYHYCETRKEYHLGSPGPMLCGKCITPLAGSSILCPSCRHPAGEVDSLLLDGGSTQCPSCGQIYHYCEARKEYHLGSPGPVLCGKCKTSTPDSCIKCPSCKHPASPKDRKLYDGGSTQCFSCGQVYHYSKVCQEYHMESPGPGICKTCITEDIERPRDPQGARAPEVFVQYTRHTISERVSACPDGVECPVCKTPMRALRPVVARSSDKWCGFGGIIDKGLCAHTCPSCSMVVVSANGICVGMF